MKKICRECKIKKVLSHFYKHNAMLDGRLNKCKVCVKKRIAKHREKNIDRIKDYDRNRPNRKERLAKHKLYLKNLSVEKLEKLREHHRLWCQRNKEKRYAHSAIWDKIKRGLVKKQPCEVCKEQKAHAHHDDYSKPLDVRWLCHSHHMEYHRNERELKRRNI